jgi:hypothetical protein
MYVVRGGEVGVEETITNVGAADGRLNRRRLELLVLRVGYVVARRGRVQPRVLGGCVGTSMVGFHSSRFGGIVVLASMVTNRERIVILVRRTLRVLWSRTGDSCLHGSLPVPLGKASYGSKWLGRG